MVAITIQITCCGFYLPSLNDETVPWVSTFTGQCRSRVGPPHGCRCRVQCSNLVSERAVRNLEREVMDHRFMTTTDSWFTFSPDRYGIQRRWHTTHQHTLPSGLRLRKFKSLKSSRHGSFTLASSRTLANDKGPNNQPGLFSALGNRHSQKLFSHNRSAVVRHIPSP